MLTLSMRPAHEPSGLNSELWFQDDRSLGSRSPPFRQHQTPRTSSSSSLQSPLSTRVRERSDFGIRSALALPPVPPRQGPSSHGRPSLGRSRSSEYGGRQTRLPQTLLPSTTYPRPLRARNHSPSLAGQDPAKTSRKSTSPRPSRHANLKLPQAQADNASGSRSAPSSVRHAAEGDSSRRPRSRSPKPTSQQGSPSSRSGNVSTTHRRTFDDDTDVSLFAEALSGIAAGPMTEPLHQGVFSTYHANEERSTAGPGPSSPSSPSLATYQPRHPYLSPATYAPAAISVPALHTTTTPSVHVISPLTPDTPFTPRSHLTPHPRSQSQHTSRSTSHNHNHHHYYHHHHPRSADYTPNQPFTHTPARVRAPATTTATSPSASLHEAMLGLSANALPTFHPNLDDDFDPLSDRIYDNDGLDLSDDELPSYEQSQRETAEKTRRIASSRAAELESRWAASSFAYR